MKSVPTARKASAIVALVVVATAIAISRGVAGLAGASWSPFDGAAGGVRTSARRAVDPVLGCST